MLRIHFWLNKLGYTLEENFTNTKTQLLCLREYLLRWLFPHLLLYQECSYGLMAKAPMLMPRYRLNPTMLASQERPHFLNVSVSHKRKNQGKSISNSHTPSHTSSSTFIHSKAVIDFKTRLFDGLYTFWQNKRLRWGLITLLILAPLSKLFYLFLPDHFGEYLVNIGPLQILNTIENAPGEYSGQGIEGLWYFYSLHMFFFSIGELMAPIISFVGIFLLFPKNYYPSYLVGLPFGYYLAMLVHRVGISNQIEFHEGVGTFMMFSFFIFGFVLFMISDKVLFKQNHRKRSSEARIMGLINLPGMSWAEKELLIRKEVDDAAEVSNELYEKDF